MLEFFTQEEEFAVGIPKDILIALLDIAAVHGCAELAQLPALFFFGSSIYTSSLPAANRTG